MKRTFKKLILLTTTTAILMQFSACSNEESSISVPQTIAENPLDTSSTQSTADPNAFDLQRDFMPYQSGGISFGDAVPEEIIYKGGEITFELELGLDKSSEYKSEEGFFVYLAGVPQKVSIDGGKTYSDMVSVSLEPGESEKVTFQFTPYVLEKDKDKDTLTLVVNDIFNPSYKAREEYPSYGNAHKGGAVIIRDIKAESPFNVVEYELPLTPTDYFQSTDSLKNEWDGSISSVVTNFDLENKNIVYSEDDGKVKNSLLFYLDDEEKDNLYYVYFYKNHEMVDVNGQKGLLITQKTDKLNAVPFEIDGVEKGDQIYAMIVSPERLESLSSMGFKVDTMLVIGDVSQKSE